jgi:hypothetical protein
MANYQYLLTRDPLHGLVMGMEMRVIMYLERGGLKTFCELCKVSLDT